MNPTAAKGQLFSKTLVAAMAKQRAFLGCIRRVSRRCSVVGFAFISGGWKGGIGPRKGQPTSVVWAEWSKALDLGSSLYGGVGSNPTAGSCGFNQGWEALRVLEKSLKIL